MRELVPVSRESVVGVEVAAQGVAAMLDQVRTQARAVAAETEQFFERLAQAVSSARDRALSQLKAVVVQKEKMLQEQLRGMEMVSDSLRRACQHLEQTVQSDLDVRVLLVKDEMLGNLHRLMQQQAEMDREPVTKADLWLALGKRLIFCTNTKEQDKSWCFLLRFAPFMVRTQVL